MTTGQNKLQARRVYDFFNQAIRTGNMSIIDEVMSADAIDHNPAGGQARAIEGVKQTFTLFHTAFPDFCLTAEDQIAEGDKVVSRVIGRGTHKGDFQGMPATNKTVTREGIDILRLSDGKVIESWSVVDTLGLLQQIGAVPMPA